MLTLGPTTRTHRTREPPDSNTCSTASSEGRVHSGCRRQYSVIGRVRFTRGEFIEHAQRNNRSVTLSLCSRELHRRFKLCSVVHPGGSRRGTQGAPPQISLPTPTHKTFACILEQRVSHKAKSKGNASIQVSSLICRRTRITGS